MPRPAEDWESFLTHLDEAHEASLSVWEIDFVDSIRDQLLRTRTVSPKQEDVLRGLRQRCDHFF